MVLRLRPNLKAAQQQATAHPKRRVEGGRDGDAGNQQSWCLRPALSFQEWLGGPRAVATTHTGLEDLQPSVSPGWPSIVNHLEPWPSWHPGFYSLPRTHSFPFPSTLPLLFKIACCDLAQPRGMAAEGSARVSWCGAWCLCRPLVASPGPAERDRGGAPLPPGLGRLASHGDAGSRP